MLFFSCGENGAIYFLSETFPHHFFRPSIIKMSVIFVTGGKRRGNGMEIVGLEEKTMKALVHFTSLEEMNEAVGMHRKQFCLSPSEREILFVISQYACKFTGVCYLSKQKIAEAAGFKTRRTAIRACNRLEQYGIIKQYETRRVRGDKRRSVNIIVIQQPLEMKKETSKSQRAVTSGCHNKEVLPYPITKTLNKKELTKNQQKTSQFESLKKKIPSVFFDVLSLHVDAQGIYDMYGLLLRAKKRAKATFQLEDYANDYMDEFKSIYHQYRQGKIQHLEGYLYRTWESVTEKIKNGLDEIDYRIVVDPAPFKNEKGEQEVGEEAEIEACNWWEMIQKDRAEERERERIKEEDVEKERERFREKERRIAKERKQKRARKREMEAIRKAEERKLDVGEDWWQQVKEGVALIEQLKESRRMR